MPRCRLGIASPNMGPACPSSLKRISLLVLLRFSLCRVLLKKQEDWDL